MKKSGILNAVPGLRKLPDFGLPAIAGMVVLGSLLGASLPFFIDAAGDSNIRLLALPTLLILGFIFLFARSALFYLIIIIRAAIDPVITAGRFAPYLGLGAALNALVIAIAMLLAIERPRNVLRIVLPMWLPLVLVTLLAAARSPDPGQAVRTFMALMTYVAVFTIPFCLKEFRKDIGFSIRLILLSSLVPVAYGFVDFLTGACGRADLRIIQRSAI